MQPASAKGVRRSFVRYKFYLDAEIEWQSRKLRGRVTDISREGMFIEIAEAPCQGASFRIYLALNTPLSLNCVVCREVPGRGVGVKFSVPSKNKKRFEALLLVIASGEPPAQTSIKVPEQLPSTRAISAPAHMTAHA